MQVHRDVHVATTQAGPTTPVGSAPQALPSAEHIALTMALIPGSMIRAARPPVAVTEKSGTLQN
jgi:hypothetical protein